MTPLRPSPCPITGHPFIRVYRDAIPLDLCHDLLKRYDEDTKVRRVGQTGSGVHANIKRCSEVPFSHVWFDLNERFFQAFRSVSVRYAEDVPTFGALRDATPIKDSNYLLQVYEPSPHRTVADGADGYIWHCDSYLPSTCGRVLAALAYLNTVEKGGETAFRAWPLMVKPVAGSLLFFPPFFDYEHCGLPPISSRKAIVTSFLVWPALPHQ